MELTEARRTRHLILRLDRGDELPAAIVRALDEAEARAGFIMGSGSLEAAEISLSTREGHARRVDAPCALVSLQGNIAISEGALSLRLYATLARETELGLSSFAGQLVWARAESVELMIVAFDDLHLQKAQPAPSAAAPSAAAPSVAAPSAAAPSAAAPSAAAPSAAPPSMPVEPQRAPSPALSESPALPPKPVRHREDLELYPELGDLVTHFHFGECEVISSDFDRIRLRQERDGRVREVALSMLRIEPPTTTPDGKRHFKLARKN